MGLVLAKLWSFFGNEGKIILMFMTWHFHAIEFKVEKIRVTANSVISIQFWLRIYNLFCWKISDFFFEIFKDHIVM